MELRPLSIKKWEAGKKIGEIGQFLAALVFWLSCKISFFTISNHTNGAAELFLTLSRGPTLGVSKVSEVMHKAKLRAFEGFHIRSKSPKEFKSKIN